MRIVKRLVATLGMAAALIGVTAGVASANPSASWLGPGHVTRGQGVSCVQQAYNYAAGRHLKVDGQYGQATYDATRDVQTIFGLDPDGIVGPQTGDVIEFLVNFKAGYDAWRAGGCWQFVPTSR